MLGCGLLAGVGLGEVAPVERALRGDLGVSRELAGWIASAITAVPAALGLPAGWWICRHGVRRAMVLGLLVLGAAGGAAAGAPDGALLLGARLAQGAGYLLVVVAAPIWITQVTDGPSRRAALALWTTVIPGGLAVAAAAGGAASPAVGWRGWLAAVAAGALLMAALGAALPAPRGPDAAGGRPLRPAALRRPALLAAGFGAVALLGLAIVVSLPTFLAGERGASSAAAGAAAGLASIGSIAGSLLAGWLLRRGAHLRALTPIGLALAAGTCAAFWSALPPAAAVLAATAALLANGVLVAAIFAAVPDVVSATGDVELANGLLAQLGLLGNLVGPPLFAAVVAASGWAALRPLAVAVTATGTGLLLAATSVSPAGPASPRR